jgi:hypothetical protein
MLQNMLDLEIILWRWVFINVFMKSLLLWTHFKTMHMKVIDFYCWLLTNCQFLKERTKAFLFFFIPLLENIQNSNIANIYIYIFKHKNKSNIFHTTFSLQLSIVVKENTGQFSTHQWSKWQGRNPDGSSPWIPINCTIYL